MSDFRSHIAVIDYGMGNLHSVGKALEHVCPGAKISITSDPVVVEDADRVVFPGVGAIRDCMGEIQRLNVGDVVSNTDVKTGGIHGNPRTGSIIFEYRRLPH